MDFRFDADERRIVSTISGVMRTQFSLRDLHVGESSLGGWQAIAADGWLHAVLPDEDGGLRLSRHLLCAVGREAGRVLRGDAWTTNALLIPVLIARIRDTGERRRWLLRHHERPGFFLTDGRRLSVQTIGSDRCEWCFGVDPRFDVYRLAISPGGRYTLGRIADAHVDFRAIAGLAPGTGEVFVNGGESAEAGLETDESELASLMRDAALLHAATLVGVAEQACAVTLKYVRVRTQFGRPVGQFQAVKHALADVTMWNELAWTAVLVASLVGESDRHQPIAARIQAAKAAIAATTTMLQLHGGIGFTWESDVHLFVKTALAGAMRFGARESLAVMLGRELVEQR